MKHLLLYIFLYSFIINAQNITFQQANNLGGYSGNVGQDVIVDKDDNVIICGTFKDSLDADLSANKYMLYNSSSSWNNVFIAKYDANGELLWAKSFGNASEEYNTSSLTDSLGNIYLMGKFSGTVDFDVNAGQHLVSAIFSDAYILKLDPNGNFIWVKNFGGTSGSQLEPRSIYVDSTDIYFCGNFLYTCDFDPSLATFNMSSSGWDAFIVKLDTSGNFNWAKKISSTSTIEVASCITVGSNGTIYVSGYYSTGADFDPNTGVVNLPSATGGTDMFVLNLLQDGSFNWVKGIHGSVTEYPNNMKMDVNQNLVITGQHSGVTDFDPGTNVYNLANGNTNIFILKLSEFGDFVWAHNFTSSHSANKGTDICLDKNNDIYIVGQMTGSIDFDKDPDYEQRLITSMYSDMFVLKYSSDGVYNWVKSSSSYGSDHASGISMNSKGQLYVTGHFKDTLIFNQDSLFSPNNVTSAFLLKMSQSGIYGGFYEDINTNCIWENFDLKTPAFRAIVKPSDLIVEADLKGNFIIDPLPPGNYYLILDSLSGLNYNCGDTVLFTVDTIYNFQIIDKIPLKNQIQCSKPSVNITAPIIRRCFTNQHIYVNSCNELGANAIMTNAYTDVKLDTLFSFLSSSLTSTDLGNNIYRFFHGDLYPGNCNDFTIDVNVSCNTVLGQTLCMEANLFPADSCTYDTIRAPQAIDFVPCQLPWDKSSLIVESWCANDSIYFTITNTGEPINGDMDCYSPVRLFIDGQYIWLDSIRLLGGEAFTYSFSGDGRTWRLEADQHPLHPGNSHPNASIEACGNRDNWTPNLITILPQDDADAVKDIYCGVVTGSYDPNDKTGYPLGVSSSHLIQANGQLDYVIRFQNTGTDTAFTVVIRDTLDTDLNIFSVQAGVSSHNYSFRMYGQRVLEWTFSNILLPDSTTNEIESHGFATFTVNQNPNLIDSTEITNNVGIYFDFNSPVITNTTSHKIGRGIYDNLNSVQDTIQLEDCVEVFYNSLKYSLSGEYYQFREGGLNSDTLLILDVNIKKTFSTITETVCYTYTAPDNQVYSQTGTYTAIIPNSQGCDSTITINLSIKNPSSSSITESVCNSYTAPDNQVYTQSGAYTAIISNLQGCDSTITIDLTIKNPSSSTITESVCNSYTAPDNQIYTQSGTYTSIIPNSQGCDSTITIALTIKSPSSSTIIETVCNSYTAPDNQIYTQSGTYTSVIPNSQGCDSTITIDLTINNLESTASISNFILSSEINDGVYQWLDCLNNNEIIQDATSQTYTVEANGEFSVVVSKNNCIDTSECILVSNVGLKTISNSTITLNPNPTSSFLTVSFGEKALTGNCKVYSPSGQVVENRNFTNKENIEIETQNYSKGMYFLELDFEGSIEIFKFIKE